MNTDVISSSPTTAHSFPNTARPSGSTSRPVRTRFSARSAHVPSGTLYATRMSAPFSHRKRPFGSWRKAAPSSSASVYLSKEAPAWPYAKGFSICTRAMLSG